MPGLDRKLIELLDRDTAVGRVKSDIKSDFILAPHYNAIFNRASGDLWEILSHQLSSGTYQPNLPITMSVPKERFFSRPGSILQPMDRLLYQALTDSLLPVLEGGLDRNRTFSHVPVNSGFEMFEPNRVSWDRYQGKIANMCGDSGYLLKADIAHYFERLPQHHLVNLMHAVRCPAETVNLLEEMMLSFRERNLFGIVQGLAPSDAFGNFYLSDFDAHCDLAGIDSARYVDDIYMNFSTEVEARQGLHQLIERLRKDGLNLNEHKTRVLSAEEVIHEETALDRIFARVRSDVVSEDAGEKASPYGFLSNWEEEDESTSVDKDDDEEGNHLDSVERLIDSIDDHRGQEDHIERFCLPILRAEASESAVEHVLDNIRRKPHQTGLYFSYLSRSMLSNPELVERLQTIATNSPLTDYQQMYALATLLRAQSVDRSSVTVFLQWLSNRRVAQETRAMAAVVAAKHGNAQQKRAVRTAYEDEPSQYVRASILYASKYFVAAERKTCKRAWGGHSVINTLISKKI